MTTPPAALASALADRYRLERELGAGGMATVYLAQDLKHDRKVAIKVLRPELAAVIGAERFLREIKTIAGFQHPHILGLIDSGEVQGSAYYVMPFVEGQSLGQRLEREQTLSLDDAVSITREVADALGYAHARGIVHRDLKPDNILLANGHALVADFGIAIPIEVTRDRLTETGMVVGTPGYMSPEQAGGERTLDGRSDLFALGCLLYEMLAGRSPFDGPTAQARIARTFTGQYTPFAIVRPEVASIDPLLGRLLAVAPEARFADAASLLRELERTITAARRPEAVSLPVPAVSMTRRRRLLAAGLGVLLLGAVLYRRGVMAPPPAVVGFAVVPFQALTPTNRDSVLARFLVEGLAARLAHLPAVEISATHALGGTGPDSTLVAVGGYARRVGARYAVAGDLGWADGDDALVQLRPRLLELAGDAAPTLRWSDSFSIAPGQLFQAEIRIARSIASVIGRAPRGEHGRRLGAVPTGSEAAYLEYLHGAIALRNDPADPQTHFERAVSLDSGFALAWAALSATCALNYRNTQSPVGRACSQRGAERAIALDSNLADAQYAAGLYARHVLKDFSVSRAHLERATALAPWGAESSQMLAAVLMSLGEWDQARVPANRAEALEPLYIQGGLRVADIAIAQHQYAEANAALDRVTRIDSLHHVPIYLHALALVQQGDLAAAQQYLAQAPSRGSRLAAIIARGLLYGRIWFYGTAERQEVLAAPLELFESHRARQLLAYAQVHWLAGRRDQARQSALAAIPWARQDVTADPENDDEGMRLALALALAGLHAEAIREGARSAALRPVSRDARIGPFTQLTFAEVLSVAGAKDSAIAVLSGLSGRPGPATPGWLATDGFLAPLRGTPSFDALAGTAR